MLRRSLPQPFMQDKMLADLYMSHLSSGSVRAVVSWLEHDMPYSPSELAEISFRFSAADLNTVFVHAHPSQTNG